VELAEHPNGVADLVESFDGERRHEPGAAAVAMAEAADGLVAGERRRGKDVRVGLPETGKKVDLVEGLLNDFL